MKKYCWKLHTERPVFVADIESRFLDDVLTLFQGVKLEESGHKKAIFNRLCWKRYVGNDALQCVWFFFRISNCWRFKRNFNCIFLLFRINQEQMKFLRRTKNTLYYLRSETGLASQLLFCLCEMHIKLQTGSPNKGEKFSRKSVHSLPRMFQSLHKGRLI